MRWKTKQITPDVTQFLSESNKIEGVYDRESLIQAERAWSYLIAEKILTPQVIKKTHKILMNNQPLQPDQRGYFRKVDVMIGGKVAEPWRTVPDLMDQWIKAVMQLVDGGESVAPGPVQEMFNRGHHVVYEKIHPFVDGNGRTGRMFMNWERLNLGLPLLTIYEKEKQNYYQWFKNQ